MVKNKKTLNVDEMSDEDIKIIKEKIKERENGIALSGLGDFFRGEIFNRRKEENKEDIIFFDGIMNGPQKAKHSIIMRYISNIFDEHNSLVVRNYDLSKENISLRRDINKKNKLIEELKESSL